MSVLENDYVAHMQEQDALQDAPVPLLRFLYRIRSGETDFTISSEDIMHWTCDHHATSRKKMQI